MSKHVAIYCRVSSKAQDMASQEAELKRYAEGLDTPARWYRDHWTGKTMDRPGWQKLWRAVERGEVKTVIVWRLDRLGRTAKGLTALFEDLIQRRVNLVSLHEGIHLDTPAGKLMANVLASVAQFETEVRAERVLAGQEVARANGKTWGGSEKGRRIKATEEKVAHVRKMKAQGKSISEISRVVGLSRPTIYSVLE
jgi:DNA invertase Pin-like site-specific DNA recombinase